MRVLLFFGLLLMAFPTFNYPGMAQKPVDSIPYSILQQITVSYYKECYDSLPLIRLSKKPVLRQKKSSYEYECSPINRQESKEGFGLLEIDKRILLGDLTCDGHNELIISAVGNSGGSSSWGYEYVFQNTGTEWNLLTYFYAPNMFLENKHVIGCLLVGNILSYDKDDAHCCPSKKEEIRLKYVKEMNEIVEVSRKFLGKVK